MPHKCHGNGGNCPSRAHPVWELPINELDRRDDPDFDADFFSGGPPQPNSFDSYTNSKYQQHNQMSLIQMQLWPQQPKRIITYQHHNMKKITIMNHPY